MSNKNDKLVRIRPDGTGITLSGKEKKTRFFQYLDYDLDDYSDVSFTLQEALSIHNHISKLQTGATAMVPLWCGGKVKCPFQEYCPFIRMGKQPPIGRQCLIELQLLKHWIYQYMEEYNVDPENFTEVHYCEELAEIEIYLLRINHNLAKPENADLMIDQVVGVDKEGDAIVQKQLSPLLEQKERFQNRMSKIVKLMVGDRQEKYKKEAALKQREDKDPSQKQADIRRKIESLARQLEKKEDHFFPAAEENSQPKVLTPDELINSIDEE
jgi:hypothetical protein